MALAAARYSIAVSCIFLFLGGQPAPAPAAESAAAPAAPNPQSVPRESYRELLKRAYEALQRGEYENAMLEYERVLGRADDARDRIQALISLAVVRLVPDSPVYDVEAATIVMDELHKRVTEHDLQYEFFGQIELLQQLRKQAGENAELRAQNRTLRNSVKTKDELILQLRALSVDEG